MGWVQYACATVVVMQEPLYRFIIGYGIYANPKWLLYPPLNDSQPMWALKANSVGAAWYFVQPASFIVGHSGVDEVYISMVFFAGLFSSVCAWIAMAIGFAGYGVMFPSLLLGYILAALEADAFMYSFIRDWRVQ